MTRSERSVSRDRDRAAIMAAAARRIARHGYHGMSMRDLARATGRGLASFYTHFASKEEVLFAIQSEAFADLVARAEGALAGVRDPSARLYAFILNHLRFFAESPDVMRVLVQEAAALPPAQRGTIRAFKERYFAIARDALTSLAAYANDGEIERVTYSFFGMLNWTYGWYDPKKHGSPEALARTIHRVALGGMAARPSPHLAEAGA
jgi:AcrR family transcriptional regulator